MQFLKNVKMGKHLLEKFSVLISVAIVWGYAHLLTVMGAYKHASDATATNCRTDRASLVVSSPWQFEPSWLFLLFIARYNIIFEVWAIR